jgi:hypothetical protein
MVDVELIKKMHERDHSIREIARMAACLTRDVDNLGE